MYTDNYKQRQELYLKDLTIDNEKLKQDIDYLQNQTALFNASIATAEKRIELNNQEIERVMKDIAENQQPPILTD